jgi:hypothetical protein
MVTTVSHGRHTQPILNIARGPEAVDRFFFFIDMPMLLEACRAKKITMFLRLTYNLCIIMSSTDFFFSLGRLSTLLSIRTFIFISNALAEAASFVPYHGRSLP